MSDVRNTEIKEGYCTLCRSRCGSLNHVLDGRLVAVSPNPTHPTGAALCAKGRAAPELIDLVVERYRAALAELDAGRRG